MNSNFSRLAQTNFSSLGCLLSLIIIAMGLSALGLGWIVNGVFIVIALLTILPVVAVMVVGWWVRRNIVTGNCTNCNAEVMALNNTTVNCTNCGEPLEVRSRQIQRVTPPGTIDIEAVEVDVPTGTTMKTIDAEIVDES